MKILIFSDSHGNVENVNKAISQHPYDYLFFLGDGIGDLGNLIYSDNVKYVKGNCDFFEKAPYEQLVEINGLRFLLVHGHNEGVKSGIGGLLKKAKEVNANYVFYGHTHAFYEETVDNVTILNPGSISTTRGGKQTFVVMELDNKKTSFQRIEF